MYLHPERQLFYIPTEPSSSQRALEAAEKLKQRSRGTSPKETGRPVAQLSRNA